MGQGLFAHPIGVEASTAGGLSNQYGGDTTLPFHWQRYKPSPAWAVYQPDQVLIGVAVANYGRVVYRVEHKETLLGPYQLCDEGGFPVLSGFDMPLPWNDPLLDHLFADGAYQSDLGLLSVCMSAEDLCAWFRASRGSEDLFGLGMVARAYLTLSVGELHTGRGQALVSPDALVRPAIATIAFEEFCRFGAWLLVAAVERAMRGDAPEEAEGARSTAGRKR